MSEELPTRREHLIETIEWNGKRFDFAIGYVPEGAPVRVERDKDKPVEVFLDGYKIGSEAEELIDDAMICISKALQCGMSPKHLTRTLGTNTLIGHVVARLADVWP